MRVPGVGDLRSSIRLGAKCSNLTTALDPNSDAGCKACRRGHHSADLQVLPDPPAPRARMPGQAVPPVTWPQTIRGGMPAISRSMHPHSTRPSRTLHLNTRQQGISSILCLIRTQHITPGHIKHLASLSSTPRRRRRCLRPANPFIGSHSRLRRCIIRPSHRASAYAMTNPLLHPYMTSRPGAIVLTQDASLWDLATR